MSAGGQSGSTASHRSALAIDVDYQLARAVLFGRVAGSGRFVSSATMPSTAMPPIDDVSVGAKQSLRAIEEHTGLRIVGPDGVDVPSSGEHGVDLFAITGQPVQPIRLVILSVGETNLSAPLLAAARRTSTIVDVLSERVRTTDGTLSGALLEREIREVRPDVLVLLQGSTAEAEWTACIGTLVGLVADKILSLIVIVAADQFQQHAAQLIGEQADLRGIDPAEFTVGDITNALEDELHSLYAGRVSTQSVVSSIEPARFVSRVRAIDLTTRFIARRLERSVVSVDVSDGLMIHWATPNMSDVLVRPDIDVFRHIRAVFDLDLQGASHWLPFSVSIEDLSHWVLNRALRPHTIADSVPDIAIERAILIELLRASWGQLGASRESAIDTIIAGRPFSLTRYPALAALSLLDVFQPDPAGGLVDIVLDTDGLVAATGAIGERAAAMAADAIEHDLLRPLATAIVVRGGGTDGELAVRGHVRTSDGESTRFTVPFGSIHLLRFDPQQTVTLTLLCEQNYSIGGQQGLENVTVGPEGDLRPGDLGILIDARGRPMRMVTDASLRAARIANWLDDLGLKM